MFKSGEQWLPSFQQCVAACEDKDSRFDGWFYVGVTSTGIYCRPSCPARTPKLSNMRFYSTAAGAQSAGFRACKRCRPNAAPGSPEWDLRADAVGRAMRLIADGVVDREGVPGLAARLGFSERHVHRMLVDAVGAGPLAIARATRAQTARVLLETTSLTATEIAFAAGFSSIRQFNATMREIYAASPSELRRMPRTSSNRRGVTLRLGARAPFDFDRALGFLAHRAVAGVEEISAGTYVRSLALPHGAGTVEISADGDAVLARFELADMRDLGTAAVRVRQLFDLDADPASSDAVLARDELLAANVAKRPGMRVAGTVDPHELAFRAVLGQQVSVRAAATAAARLVALCGAELNVPSGSVTHTFPTAPALAELDPESLPMPRARARALVGLAGALAAGDVRLDGGEDRPRVRAALLALPGIGDWTAQYISMRALRDPDAFLPGDLGARRGLEALGVAGDARAALAAAEQWRPYRAYGLQHLWAVAEAQQLRRAEAQQ